MAKDKKNQAAAAANVEKPVVENGNNAAESNIEEQIKKTNSLGKDFFDKAAEELANSRKEIAVNEAKEIISRSEYTNGYALLQLRYQRKKEKVVKSFLDKTKTLLEETREGKYTKIEHDKKYNEAINERQKAIDEAKAEFNTAVKELKRNFNSWDCWSWDRDWNI